MKILFLHGWHSVPGGVKPTYLADHGHEVINPALPDDDFAAALAIAQAEYDKHQPDVILGSSRGGALAMNLETGDAPLVLLCPAWKKYGTAKTIRANSTILHSRGDDVVPFADSEELASKSGAKLIEVGNDHRLADPEPLAKMLEACERGASDQRTERLRTTMTHPPTLRSPTEGLTIAVVGDIYRFLATGDETDGKYAMLEAIVPPGGGPPPHTHSREEESFYILEGEITFTVGEERIIATAGTFANMPVGSLHSFKNATDKTARMIISVAPAGLEKMFFEVGVPVKLGETPPLPTKAEIDKLLSVAPNYGVEIKVPRH